MKSMWSWGKRAVANRLAAMVVLFAVFAVGVGVKLSDSGSGGGYGHQGDHDYLGARDGSARFSELLFQGKFSPDFVTVAEAQNAPGGTDTTTPAAQTTSTTLVPVTAEELRAGLWRDGKAVFSDIELLDLFTPAPYARGYKPDQPINFSHRLHVEKNGMECQYCHANVAKSSFATIPPLELCMGCHATVRADQPEIKKLKEYWEAQKPIPWEPVNNLPEHAHFNHERHIKAGVGCQSCHGQVQKMDKVERVSSLKMGFCVSCHRDRGVTIDCAACHY